MFAKKIVDATGSAEAARLAGFAIERSPRRQPGTLVFKMSGFEPSKIDLRRLRKAMKEASAKGELGARDVWNFGGLVNEMGYNALYVPGADSATPASMSETNIEGRKVLMRVFRFLKKQKGFENARIESVKPETGVRETARIVGEKTLTAEEYRGGAVFADSLCYSYYPTDLHDMDGLETIQQKEGVAPTIPLSILTPKGAKNMLVAGRCASSDSLANSALRVQASCMAMGQAAGCVSALAARRGVANSAVDIAEIKKALRENGAIVP